MFQLRYSSNSRLYQKIVRNVSERMQSITPPAAFAADTAGGANGLMVPFPLKLHAWAFLLLPK